MSLTEGKANVRERKQMTLPKKGPRPAVLSGIIDIGVQQQVYLGEKKPPRREFIPIFTLCNDTYETDDGEVKNCAISPYSVKHLPGAERGKYFEFYNALDPEHKVLNEKGEGNVFDLIGSTCLVTVKHTDPKEDDNGFIYPRFGGVSELPEDYPVDVPAFDPLVFNLDAPSKEVFETLYPKTKERIRGSLDYVGSAAEKVLDSEEGNQDGSQEEDKAPY